MTVRRFNGWQREVVITGLLDTGDISNGRCGVVSKTIARRLHKAVKLADPLRDDELTEIIERFRVADDVETVNGVLKDLYEWGDRDKRLHVTTEENPLFYDLAYAVSRLVREQQKREKHVQHEDV